MTSRSIFWAVMLACVALVAAAPAQAWTWDDRYDSGYDDYGRALIVASDGTSFVFGDVGDSSNTNILIRKLDADGTELWTRVYDNPNNRPDFVKAAAQLDTLGVAAVGSTFNPNQGHNWRIVRYGGAGLFKWAMTYNGPANKDDVAEDVTIYHVPDGVDLVYVAGWSTNSDDTIDLVVQKYAQDSSTTVWTQRYAGRPASVDAPHPVHVAVDVSGNVYVAGTVYSSILGRDCYLLNKYTSGGSNIWSFYGGLGDSELRDMEVVGNYAYLTGRVTDGNGRYRMCTEKIALSNGAEAWGALNTYYGNLYDVIGNALAVDGSGNVYVVGYSPSLGALAYKYGSADGDELEVLQMGGDEAVDVTLDGSGNVGIAVSSDSGYVFYLEDSALDYITADLYNYGPGIPAAIGVDGSGNFYITGASTDSDLDVATVKFTP